MNKNRSMVPGIVALAMIALPAWSRPAQAAKIVWGNCMPGEIVYASNDGVAAHTIAQLLPGKVVDGKYVSGYGSMLSFNDGTRTVRFEPVPYPIGDWGTKPNTGIPEMDTVLGMGHQTPSKFTLANLTPGRKYQLQIWTAAGPNGFRGDESSVTTYQGEDKLYLVFGTFTADAPTQTIHVEGDNSGGTAIWIACLVVEAVEPTRLPMNAEVKSLSVIPTPTSCKLTGGNMVLTAQSRIVAGKAELMPLAKVLSTEIEQLVGLKLEASEKSAGAGDIELAVDSGLKDEAYTLDVDTKATIKAGNASAVAQGSVTLLQSLLPREGGIVLPKMHIQDSPAVGYRGLMIDCGRNWHPAATIKSLVELCRWYKVRYLQLHLSDDESFTFPSTAYPQLATKDRHYTLEELRDLETFARDRGVTIVPEIDVPGHATAIVKAAQPIFGGGGNVIGAGREETYKALDTLVGEVCAVFASTPYFHIGGDEVNKGFWGDPDTAAYMKAHDIADGEELYRHFIVRMNEIVKKHDKKMIVWEGFGPKGKIEIPKDITVMAYEIAYYQPDALVKDGYNIVNASWTPLYVVNGNCRSPEEIYVWNVFQFKPFKAPAAAPGVNIPPTPQVLGAQMCAWEQPALQELHSLRHRLPAMSERIWNPNAKIPFADFKDRLRATDAGLSAVLPLLSGGTPRAESPAAPVATTKVHVDAGKKIGTIKAIHGVNGGPICCGSLVNLTKFHKGLGIPLNRIHDVDWPATDKVNIHSLFPTFKADAESPDSYRFAPTDDYIKSILDTGAGVMYRLGESIEHTPRQYYVDMPADFDQWAKICIGIIKHYNEGWANGFKWDLKYFEIWNEADTGSQQMWHGSAEDYYKLYAATAKAIKTRWPNLKVGGPATGNYGRLEGDRVILSDCTKGFLEFCRRESLPLDFFSWHIYENNPAVPVRANVDLRRILDEYGFKKTELHMNEWNYLPDHSFNGLISRDGAQLQKFCEQVSGLHGAAFSACVLLGLQDSPVDMTNYYTADTMLMSMFTVHGVPTKTYHAFRAFKALVDHPSRVAVQGSKPGELNAAAGLSADGRELAIVVSNYRSSNGRIELELQNLPWPAGTSELLLLDATHNLDSIRKEEYKPGPVKIVQDLPAPGILLVIVRAK